MKRISIIPVGGLCNRMRVISSAISIATELRSECCTIYWNNNKDCSADFKDLFNPIDIKSVEIVENKGLLHQQPTNGNFQIPRILQKIMYQQIIWGFNAKTDGNIMNKIKPTDNLLLYTCHSLYKHYPLNEIFVPCADILVIIDLVTSSFATNTIGLHIRRTDHVKAKKLSPLSYFCNIIEREINNKSDTKFFLATDDESVKTELEEKYSGRIITYNGELTRTSTTGMKDAVVDLFALSRTKKIYGSAASSYSELAAEIGGIPLIINN